MISTGGGIIAVSLVGGAASGRAAPAVIAVGSVIGLVIMGTGAILANKDKEAVEKKYGEKGAQAINAFVIIATLTTGGAGLISLYKGIRNIAESRVYEANIKTLVAARKELERIDVESKANPNTPKAFFEVGTFTREHIVNELKDSIFNEIAKTPIKGIDDLPSPEMKTERRNSLVDHLTLRELENPDSEFKKKLDQIPKLDATNTKPLDLDAEFKLKPDINFLRGNEFNKFNAKQPLRKPMTTQEFDLVKNRRGINDQTSKSHGVRGIFQLIAGAGLVAVATKIYGLIDEEAAKSMETDITIFNKELDLVTSRMFKAAKFVK